MDFEVVFILKGKELVLETPFRFAGRRGQCV
jgi:hypothetical protein